MSVDEGLKARLLKPRVPEGTVELEGLGTIRVRGLSRGEVFMIKQIKGTQAMERKMVALSMLDPVMTEDEVRQWQQSSPAGELEPVTNKINELSGLGPKSEKQAMATFRDEPGHGVRVLPGDEAGDDGGPTAGADEQ
jgi:hypothetical protein